MTVDEVEQLRSRLLRLSGDLADLMGRVAALRAKLDAHSAQVSPVHSPARPSREREYQAALGAR